MNLVCRCRTLCSLYRFEWAYVPQRLKSQTSKEVRILSKLLSKTPKKRFFVSSGGKSGVPSISGDPIISKVTTNIRSAVLDKLFMNYVTDIMATGSFSEQLLGHGIEITHLKVSQDYQFMNIYWIAKTSDDNYLEQTLKNLAFPLRHELSQLHLVGTVPRINFIRDVLHARLAEVDRLLEIADKGNDEDSDDMESSVEDVFPRMPMNVYGLEHDKIVDKLMQAKARSKSLFTKQPNLSPTSLRSVELQTESLYNQREVIKKFLRLKRLSRMKKDRKENKHPYEDESLLCKEESDNEEPT